jgi:hypothetical protein
MLLVIPRFALEPRLVLLERFIVPRHNTALTCDYRGPG